MSRLGKKVIAVPANVEASFASGIFHVKGPNGELSKNFKSDITVTIADKEITLKPVRTTLETAALWGTYASHIVNMLNGVVTSYSKKLILEGIGYKCEVKGDKLVLALGFSHPVEVVIPKSLKVTSEKGVVTVTGIDKEEVGLFTANLRALKKPEPYKGKGFRYDSEVIKRKQGKKTA